jgi:hypothetical protein
MYRILHIETNTWIHWRIRNGPNVPISLASPFELNEFAYIADFRTKEEAESHLNTFLFRIVYWEFGKTRLYEEEFEIVWNPHKD